MSASSVATGEDTIRLIRVGHSPDPDDAFMFYALAQDKIPTGSLRFVHELQDIETLNLRALQGELEVSAVSIHAYAYLADRYALLSCGCSMGDKYGPILVSRRRLSLRDLPDVSIAVPGTLTTAFLVLQLLMECLHARQRLRYEVIPFEQILNAVATGRCDAGLIIHEGQLTFRNLGMNLIVDLGVWWQERTGLPLPLGGNVVRKDLGPELMRQINHLVRESIRYGLAHREQALAYARQYARDLDITLVDRFVAMYVNDWTLDYGSHGRAAIQRLLEEAAKARILSTPPPVEFVT
jgi:1,4-dihydroxy-6-naphthoate synthase